PSTCRTIDRLERPLHQPYVSFVLAECFDEIGIRKQGGRDLRGPGLQVRFRIVDRDLDVHVPDVAPREALGDTPRLGLRMARSRIDPGAAIASAGLDDARLAFPVSH